MVCPKCQSENVMIQQVQTGATSRTKTKVYSTHHGFLWWIFVGSWWWIVDLMIKITLFFCTGGLSMFFRHKHKVGQEKGITRTTVKNSTMCTCQNCGYSWKI